MMYRKDLMHCEIKELEDLLQHIDKHIIELENQVKNGYVFHDDRINNEKWQRAEIWAALEKKIVQDVVNRWKSQGGAVNMSLSQRDIIAIIHHTKLDNLDKSEKELLLNVNHILQNADAKAEVVADVFRTFCHITPLSKNVTGNAQFMFKGFEISCGIPKKFADAINLRADEIRLQNSTIKQKADEIYNELTK